MPARRRSMQRRSVKAPRMGAWSAPTDPETVARRASGRRRYNAWRQNMALYRRAQVAALLNYYGWLPRAGVQRTIAAHLGVSEATISRDVRAILTLPSFRTRA